MPPWFELTQRQRAVVVRVAAGMTNREIALDLGLGPATVKHHLSSAQAKLGARNRTQVAVIALVVDPIIRAEVAGLQVEAS